MKINDCTRLLFSCMYVLPCSFLCEKLWHVLSGFLAWKAEQKKIVGWSLLLIARVVGLICAMSTHPTTHGPPPPKENKIMTCECLGRASILFAHCPSLKLWPMKVGNYRSFLHLIIFGRFCAFYASTERTFGFLLKTTTVFNMTLWCLLITYSQTQIFYFSECCRVLWVIQTGYSVGIMLLPQPTPIQPDVIWHL